jgi:hypothetical protein
MDRYEALLENYRNAWAGLRMIRDAVEELGPVGVLPSQEAAISRYGPEPIHQAQSHCRCFGEPSRGARR